jgi:hypothetical protein
MMFETRKYMMTGAPRVGFGRTLCVAAFAAVWLSACGGDGGNELDTQSWLGKAVEPSKSSTVANTVNGGKANGATGGTGEARGNSTSGGGSSGGGASNGGSSGGSSSGGGSSGGGSSGGGSSGGGSSGGGSSGGGSSGGGSSGGGSSSGGSSGGGSSGGGSSGGGSSSDGSSGGSSSGSGSSSDTPSGDTPTTPSNTASITIDNTLGATVNQPYVTVKLCPPNAQTDAGCSTVDHMLLDTGSIGVRVFASALGSSLSSRLPRQTGASNDPTGSAPLAQCALFGSGYLWGALRRADVTIGSMTARDIPVQIVGDAAYGATPADCEARGVADLGTVDALGAKGVVGIGHRARDFPQAAQTALAATYYYCASATSCTAARVPLERQAMNPVAGFATDNNGTIIRLPALPSAGQASATGELIFGVGTRSNNALPANATILAVSAQGTLTTLYANRSVPAIVDSGTNGLMFRDTTIPTGVNNWFSPQTTLSLTATMMSTIGLQASVPFSIADAERLFESNYAAYDNLGALSLSSNMFVWGLPFYYGRSVYTVLSDAQAGGKPGPFVAF